MREAFVFEVRDGFDVFFIGTHEESGGYTRIGIGLQIRDERGYRENAVRRHAHGKARTGNENVDIARFDQMFKLRGRNSGIDLNRIGANAFSMVSSVFISASVVTGCSQR